MPQAKRSSTLLGIIAILGMLGVIIIVLFYYYFIVNQAVSVKTQATALNVNPVPNPSFENWQTLTGGVLRPQSWIIGCFSSCPGSSIINQSTDAQSGVYSLLLNQGNSTVEGNSLMFTVDPGTYQLRLYAKYVGSAPPTGTISLGSMRGPSNPRIMLPSREFFFGKSDLIINSTSWQQVGTIPFVLTNGPIGPYVGGNQYYVKFTVTNPSASVFLDNFVLVKVSDYVAITSAPLPTLTATIIPVISIVPSVRPFRLPSASPTRTSSR